MRWAGAGNLPTQEVPAPVVKVKVIIVSLLCVQFLFVKQDTIRPIYWVLTCSDMWKKKLKFHNTQSKLLLGMANLRWSLPTDGFSSSAFPETSSSSQLPPIWAKPGNGDLGGDFPGDEFESKDWTEPVPVWGRLISPNVPACDWQKRRCQGRRRSLRQTRTLQGPPGSKALSQMNCPPAQTGPSQNRLLVNFLNPSIPVIIRSLAQFFSILTFWNVQNRF